MTDTLRKTVSNGLCHGCGACAAAVPGGKVRMQMAADGYLRPLADGALDKVDETVVEAVCSGAKLTQNRTPGIAYHDVWGPIVTLATGYSTDPETRYRGSSGGVISAAVIYLLEHGLIDFVLQTSADLEDPISNITRASFSREEVLDAAGSRYAPSSPLQHLEKYLAMGKRFAFVGKPCDVASLRRMEQHDERIARLIPYKLAFFCAGVPSRLGTVKVLDALGVEQTDVTQFVYRGRGWPGLTRATRADGSEESMDYNSSWGTILNRHLQFRCKVCVDGIGEFADLVCADAWYGKDGYPDFVEREGRSLVVARTVVGQQVLDAMLSSKALEVTPLDIGEVARMQPYQIDRKRAVLARLLGVMLKGRRIARYRNFGLLKLTVGSSPAWLLRNAIGTFRRTPRNGDLH